MARTRTLHPVRARALHYAVTQKQRHAKPLVYAGLSFLGRIALLVCAAGLVASAQTPAAPCLDCQAFSALPEQLGPLPAQLQGTRVLVRVSAGAPLDAIRAALAEVVRRGGRTGVHLVGLPEEQDPALAADADLILIEIPPAEHDGPDQQAFDLKRALTRARGQHPTGRLLLTGSSDTLAALMTRGIGAYVDGTLPPPAPLRTADDLLAPTEVPLRVWTLPPDGSGSAAIAAIVPLQSWLPSGLVRLRERSLQCGEDRPLPTFLNPQTLDLVAVSGACPAPALVTSDMGPAERVDVGGVSAFRARANAEGAFATGVDVAAARQLTVEEIVARHQAASANQTAAIESEIADGSMTLTFEAPGFVAPVTVTSRTTIYRRDDRTDLRQRDIRVNGVRFDTDGGVPRLPIIEPERAAAPPLAITLSDVYRYRLDGRESVDGRPTYVVAFTPRDGDAALFSGRAWIDAETFGMVRVSAVQTGLRGPITASEQTDEYALDGQGRWLLARSDVHQTYEGASIRTPIHRRVLLDRHQINPPDFEALRTEAYASPDVMLRDTPDGFRYLKRSDKGKPEAGHGEPATGNRPLETGDRVLAGRADRIRTVAFGVIVDPNISQPLPFAGLSYVDFNLFGTGTQFNGFFGGSYAQVAFSAPSVAGSRWQLAGRAFAIATSYNDRAFEQGREQYELDIRQRPAQAAVWALRPIGARAAVRIEYDWDFNAFGAGEQTAAGFVIPRDQNAHALRLGLDLQRNGWQGSIWGSYARRVGWRAWGAPAAADAGGSCTTCAGSAQASFTRYGASVLRSQAISTRVAARIEGAVMGGHDLDRFSRYAFGTFDNRLHGYPAALVRYDRGAVLRTAIAWTAGRAVRLDGFADTAVVRDPGFGRGLRNYTGFGAALEAPAPFRTLLSIEWGYGLQGVDTTGGRGTNVVRIAAYKVF